MTVFMNPASFSISLAFSRPHMAPSPMPPCAKDTVIQCMHEMVYRRGAIGWS